MLGGSAKSQEMIVEKSILLGSSVWLCDRFVTGYGFSSVEADGYIQQQMLELKC